MTTTTLAPTRGGSWGSFKDWITSTHNEERSQAMGGAGFGPGACCLMREASDQHVALALAPMEQKEGKAGGRRRERGSEGQLTTYACSHRNTGIAQ